MIIGKRGKGQRICRNGYLKNGAYDEREKYWPQKN